MRRLLVPLIAAIVLVLGFGTFAVAQDATPPGGNEAKDCAGMATPGASPTAAETEEAMASPTAGEGCEVRIENFAFSPATIQISVGDTVTWENYDDAPHTVTGDNNEFDSGNLPKGQKFTHTFTTAGTIKYHCNIHSNMHGTIIVS